MAVPEQETCFPAGTYVLKIVSQARLHLKGQKGTNIAGDDG
jgi:hypothetical protein